MLHKEVQNGLKGHLMHDQNKHTLKQKTLPVDFRNKENKFPFFLFEILYRTYVFRWFFSFLFFYCTQKYYKILCFI